jgi:hypothetical protein
MLIKKCQAKSSLSSNEININLQPLDNGNNQNNNNAINLNNNRYNKEIIGPIAFIIGTLSLFVILLIFSPTFLTPTDSVNLLMISYTFQDFGPLLFLSLIFPLYFYVTKKDLKTFLYDSLKTCSL